MKKRKKKERGSITVFVTAILIPTIFVSAFLTDLARIKLYSNQALMTADNYGEAVLTQYDDLLKELYGLFAVSQDEEAMKAVEDMQEYMKTSFDPTQKTISFAHLQGTVVNKGTSYSGFMPYKSAELNLAYEPASDKANLGNNDVLATQIGDFMRYRIMQSLTDGGDWLLDAVDQVQNSKADTDVMAEKDKRDKVIEDALEAMQDFYTKLVEMDDYQEGYLKHLNEKYQSAKGTSRAKGAIKRLIESERYQTYIEAAKAQESADGGKDEEEAGDTEGEEENTLDLDKEGKYFSDEFDKIIKKYSDCYNDGEPHDFYKVTFSNYNYRASELVTKAVKVQDELEKVKEAQARLDEKMNAENVTETLKENLKEENNDINKLFDGSDPAMKGSTYVALAKVFTSSTNTTCNTEFFGAAEDIEQSLKDAKDYYLRYYDGTQDQYPDNYKVNYVSDIKISQFDDFKKNSSYSKLYENLKKSFNSESDSDEEKKAKEAKKEGKKKSEEKQKALEKEDDETTARNIPDDIAIGDNKKAKLIKGGDMLQSAAGLLNNSFEDNKNELLLKLYTVNYDMDMFSNRVTNVSTGEGREIKKSLTGYEMSKKINYLYQAELEYLYGGHKSSKENLKETRNTIVLFRTAVNLASTYTIKEVNQAIRAITEGCAAINPVLGIVAAAALRLGVASIETYQDWKMLKEGESVILIKTKVQQLNAFDEIAALLPGLTKGESGSDSSTKVIKLNYEQYLLVLLFALTPGETLYARTGDLICLNVNNVKQGGTLSSLEFKMKDAVTAVKTSCSVHLNYLIIPDGFAKATVDGDVYNEMKEFEKNKYKFSVIRGY